MADNQRQQDFKQFILLLLTAVHNNQDLHPITNNISNIIETYSIPEPIATFPFNTIIDNNAKQLIPPDAPNNYVPLRCTGNGNCFFNAVSMLLIGNEEMATELRVRTAVALLQLKDQFTDPSNTAMRDLIHEQAVLYSPFSHNDQRVNRNVINNDEISIVFNDELKTTLTDNAWSGMWQLIGCATAIQMPIWSIYPNHNIRIRNLFNKVVLPLVTLERSMYILPIMWSGYEHPTVGFVPNHFVPMIPQQYMNQYILPAPIDTLTLFTTEGTSIRQEDVDLESFMENQDSTKISNIDCSTTNHENLETIHNRKTIHNYLRKTSFMDNLSRFEHFCSMCGQRILSMTLNRMDDENHYCCSLCFRYISKGEESPLDKKYMYPGDIPQVLSDMNATERKLLSQIHPYMKMVFLPSGGQHGLNGQSINIPVPMQNICADLPRTEEQFPYIKIYSAKNEDHYEIVNVKKVNAGLEWLMINNIYYKDVHLIQFNPDMQSFKDCNDNYTISVDSELSNELQEVSFIPNDYQINMDKNRIQNYKMPIMTGAPINIFNTPYLEELAFPHLYPYGTHGLRYDRNNQPTIHQYFKCRLLNIDTRWSSNPQYMFWALHLYEQEKLQQSISCAIRKKHGCNMSVNDTSNAINMDEKSDNYMFMSNMHGTAAYWKNELKKLMAKIRTFGPPTFFMSLSANDINWEDNIAFMKPNLSREEIKNLSFPEKARILRENPIASSIHFNNRWERFLYQYLLKPPYPLGRIENYFARIEFQMRGSPHLHILLWIAIAPSFENDDKSMIVPFIDRYITAQLSQPENPKLEALVKSLQTHNHTDTCFRNNRCRFDFPMPVSQNTRLKTETDTGNKTRFYLLKRSEEDIYVNPYNKDILENWQANMDLQFVGSMYAVAKYVCAYICKNEPLHFRQRLARVMKQLPPQSSKRKILSNIGNILLTHRTIGLQETAYRMLGLQMVYSSRDSVYIDVSLPQKRYRILKPKRMLEQLPPDSTDIYNDGMYEYYMNRPNTEIFETMCLSQYVTNYKTTTSIPKSDNPTRSSPRHKITISGKETILMKRKQPSCLRCTIPDILKDEEAHYYSLLCLFLPFRDVSDIIKPYNSYQEAFINKQHKMNKEQMQLTKLANKFEKAVQHLLSLEQHSMDDIGCLTAPTLQHANEEAIAEGVRESPNVYSFDILDEQKDTQDVHQKKDFNIDMFKKIGQLTMTTEEFQQRENQLTQSQKMVYDYIKNHQCQHIPMHLFITGGAGTGKSFLLKLLKEYLLRQNNQELPNVVVAAPTGVAAYNINGHTLHTLLQLPTQENYTSVYSPLTGKSLKFLSEVFKNVRYLIIDEISMVGYKTLQHIHLRLNEIKGHYLDANIYFGNINILAFGDLYQLPPVGDSAIFSTTNITTYHLWKDNFRMCELQENKRQSADSEYASMLNRIRIGIQTNEDIQKLSSRLITDDTTMDGKLHIYPTKEARNGYNASVVNKLGQNNQIYEINAVHNQPEKFIPIDDQKCAGLPKKLILCQNARVMLIRNIDTPNGLVNGAQGTVHSIEWDNTDKNMPRCVNVIFDNKDALLHTDNNQKHPIGITPITVNFLGNDHTYVTRTQIPLVLSFATTIHKVQGLTLKSCVCDVGPSIFRGGMAYVALSRVSTLENLHLSKLCPPRIHPSSDVVTEMERLRDTSI